DHYRTKYGSGSPQYQSAGPGISKTKYEAYVAEQLINDLLEAESAIQVVKRYYPSGVDTDNREIKQVRFESCSDEAPITIHAGIFADCSYEGDLLAVAGAEYRLGRESTDEYGEKYA